MTIIDILIECINNYGNKDAFLVLKGSEERIITYIEFYNDVCKVAQWICEAEINNQFIGIWGENSYEYIVSYFAILISGNIVVPLERELSMEQVDKNLTEINSGILLCDNYNFGESFDSKFIAYNYFDIICNFKNEKIEFDFSYSNVTENSMAVLVCTSGTMSKSKKVPLSHRNIVQNAISVSEKIGLKGSSLLVLPLAHMYAFTAATLVPLVSGTKIIISKHVRYFMEELYQYNPNTVFLVPILVKNLLSHIMRNEKINENILINLQSIYCGGAPLSNKIVEKFKELGIDVYCGYGMSECSPVISVNTLKENKINSVGRPIGNVKVRISNPNFYGVGEICIKGSSVMNGYYNESTENPSIVDGWFKTGDLGRIDQDGYVYIEGRSKNMLLTDNGQNIYPEEIEQMLLEYKIIKEVVVFQKDNYVIAEIYPDYTCIDGDIVQVVTNNVSQVNSQLPLYKSINQIIIREHEFEKTSLNKIKRT